MVIINTDKFYVGNGDGHETGNAPDLSCAGVTASLPKNVAAIRGSHLSCEISAVEIYLISRGNWSLDDMFRAGPDGFGKLEP